MRFEKQRNKKENFFRHRQIFTNINIKKWKKIVINTDFFKIEDELHDESSSFLKTMIDIKIFSRKNQEKCIFRKNLEEVLVWNSECEKSFVKESSRFGSLLLFRFHTVHDGDDDFCFEFFSLSLSLSFFLGRCSLF